MVKLQDLGTTRHETTLSNGVRLVFFERPGAPLSLRALFFSGARFDPQEKEGLAHFMEHMIVAGTKRFPTKDKLAAYIEQYGGKFSAFTGSEGLAVNVAVADPGDIDVLIEVLNEILIAGLFNEKSLETERLSILKEIGDRKSDPGDMLWELYAKLFFQEQDLGHSVLGSEKSVRAISRDDILNYYNSSLVSGRAVFVGSGGISPSVLKQKLEAIPLPVSGELKIGNPLPVIRNENTLVETYVGKDQVHLMIGFRTCASFHPDMPALDILATILGGGRASSLTRLLRQEKGLVYTVSAGSSGYSDTGTWRVRTSTGKDKVQEVLDIICGEFNRVYEGKVTPEELQFVKDKIVKSQRMELQTSGSWVDFHCYRELVTPTMRWTVRDFIEDISSVTMEDLARVGEQYFTKGSWFLAMCGDIDKDKIAVNF